MAWLYLPASVVLNLDCTEPSPDTKLSVTLSGTAMQRPLSWQGWSRRPWVKLLSGTMYAPSTADRGAELWIKALSAEGSRAKTYPTLTPPEPVLTGSARGSGPSLLGSPCAIYEAATSSLRTSAPSLFEDLTESSLTLPKAGTMRSGTCFERSRSARRTAVSGSSYSRNEYPTPSAAPYGTSQNEGKVAHKRPTAGTPGLETWAKNWPTPAATHWKGESQFAKHGRPHRTSDAVASWATPTAGDAKQSGAAGYPTDGKRNAGTTLTDMVSGPRGPLGRKTKTAGEPTSQPEVRRLLSPNFVEALMGFQVGWSSAQIGSAVLETESSRKPQSSLG